MGILQRAKNEYESAAKSYEEALGIRRDLARLNPQTYLPSMADTLNNLGILQSAKHEYESAVKSYEEALEIRRDLVRNISPVFEIKLADTCLCLSNLYRYGVVNRDASLKFAQEALALYKKYENTVYHAKKWGAVAQKNLDYWKEKE